jgi:hypothetical protein
MSLISLERRRGIIDLNLFLIGIIVVLIMAVLGFVESKVEWAIFPGMGVVIGTFLTLSLWADGSLTEMSGSTSVAIMSASTNVTSAWSFVQLIPLLFTFTSFLIAVYRVGKAF